MPTDSITYVWQMWPVFGAAVALVGLYVYGRFAVAAVGIAAIVGFILFFELAPITAPGQELTTQDLLSGLANPALITIIALLILGQGLSQSRALDFVADRILVLSGSGTKRTLALFLATVFVLSAFVNDTPVVVMFLPIMSALSHRLNLPASRIVMSLSFVAILGGMATVMGTSTNILVAGAALQSGVTINFFDPTPMGLLLGLVGISYLAVFAPRLLPTRHGISEDVVEDGKQFLVQVVLASDHPLIGAEPVAGMFRQLPELTVRMVMRKDEAFFAPYEGLTLQEGDSLIVAATRKSLTNLFADKPEFLEGLLANHQDDVELNNRPARNIQMSEVVIAPSSRMVGRTIEQIGFRHLTDCIPVGIQRRSRMIAATLSSIRLEAGDVLLVLGRPRAIRALRTNRDVLLLDWQTSELPSRIYANRARLIFGLVVATAATGLLPMVVAALSGAALMLATGCLSLRQAFNAIDTSIYFLVASSLALAMAMERTGGAHFIANEFLALFEGAPPQVVLSALFLVVALLTNVLTNNATAIVFAPIAIQMGQDLGGLSQAFALTVLFGANMSFATPIGYQTNLLVMGPGQYRFVDFVRLGLPLVILLWIVFTFAAPLLLPGL